MFAKHFWTLGEWIGTKKSSAGVTIDGSVFLVDAVFTFDERDRLFGDEVDK